MAYVQLYWRQFRGGHDGNGFDDYLYLFHCETDLESKRKYAKIERQKNESNIVNFRYYPFHKDKRNLKIFFQETG